MANDQRLSALRSSEPNPLHGARPTPGGAPPAADADIAPPPAVSVRNVSRSFGEVEALTGVSLDAAPGEFVSILGPSGCGKTTLLRIIAGFEGADSGSVSIAGRDMARIEPHRRPANMVFQRYALFPHMTVAENIAFGPRLQRRTGAEIDGRIDELLRLVRLEGYRNRRPAQLSGGQAQRVALARALANDPVVLLLDEPLAALDLKLRQAMRLELRDIQTQVGSTFIYVTHDQEDALTTSDRIVLMNAGAIEQIGTPEDVYGRPATRFVADFIGDTNLIEGEVVSATPDDDPDGPARVLLRRGERTFTGRSAGPGGDAIRAWLCVRPEAADIHPIDEPLSTPPGAELVGTIDKVVFLGSAVRYLVRHDDGAPFLAQAEGGRRRRSFAAGDKVRVSWEDDAATVVWS